MRPKSREETPTEGMRYALSHCNIMIMQRKKSKTFALVLQAAVDWGINREVRENSAPSVHPLIQAFSLARKFSPGL